MTVKTRKIDFRMVHCVTFGAPPVSTIPITQPNVQPFQSGLFLNVVNEGDPVPMVQKDYIKTLLNIYILSPLELSKLRDPGVFEMPPALLKVSGNLLGSARH
ncbi:hypothetical protein F5B21DRAFT_481320 [Xylaria acuta]|nr:hypothetical protein F5B21DRAFT_481320 [Xylaria acuta]